MADGNIDFLIYQKTCVQELAKVSVISRQENHIPRPEIEPGSPGYKSDVPNTTLLGKLMKNDIGIFVTCSCKGKFSRLLGFH